MSKLSSLSKKQKVLIVALVVLVAVAAWALWPRSPAQDEAMAAGLGPEHFRQAADEADYFRESDGGVQLSQAAVRGRNTWWLWTGGNEAFWDYLANHSFGTFDLLKTLSSYPCSPEQEQRARQHEARLASGADPGGTYGEDAYGRGGYAAPPALAHGTAATEDTYAGACVNTMYPASGQAPYRYYERDTRFCFQGLINEPGFEKASQPDDWGLCLDRRVAPPEPFDEKIYGRPSGVLGLRLFDNPEFFTGKNAERHQRRWREAMTTDAFYLDSTFFNDPKLVRPYRVGMSCGFCHISPHPNRPPEDPENPTFAELSGTIGAQYFWFGRIFGPNVTPDNFVWHMLATQRPGAVDTSFVPADNLNNPRAMNAVFDLATRAENGTLLAVETSDGGALDLPEVQRHKDSGYSFGVPHVLWDGADSVGIDAALTRVYINIGEYHQEWVRHIDPILGLKRQTPITVKAAQENSTYWNATQERAEDMAAYLIEAGRPMPLAATPGAEAHLPADAAQLERGKVVFAESCARCHTSANKLPQKLVGLGEEGCIGEGYLECWKRYWEWTETEEFKSQMREIVLADDFLENNYLSNDARVPVHQPLIEWQPSGPIRGSVREQYLERARQRGIATGALESEICSAMATNALEGHVWDNFASRSYKSLPAVGEVELYDPLRQEVFPYRTGGGGRGYQRVPSLISVWSTAPYLHNNEVGLFTGDPSVEGRLAAFDDGIRKLLWPERRPGTVHLASRVTNLKVSTALLPGVARALLPLRKVLGLGFIQIEDDMALIGPIPKGTPINLVANLNASRQDADYGLFGLGRTLHHLTGDLKTIYRQRLDEQQASDLLRQRAPELIEKSACPDFIVDRGHYFGTDLSDEDKEALIQFVKTL
ncbi:MAG TPA: hypothetical protein VHQ65_03345 [Thermoanaerobaculia bacterium]|nr:hypothetical protein [Thermoanaerobaculia bacterium]